MAIVAIADSSFAQYSGDAFRFSTYQSSATARFNGLGGAQTSVGGDLSSLYSNPAGLGMFTKSEFSLTPSFNSTKNDAAYLGLNNSSTAGNVNLNNIGVVFHSPVSKTGDLKKGLISLNFGVGYQKSNFFKNDIVFGGETNFNGLGDYFAEVANRDNKTPENLTDNLTYAAWQGFLINDVSATRYNPITSETSDQYQKINRKGGQSNIDFSLGLNISNTVYLGAGIGLASINYQSQEVLNEQGLNNVEGETYNYSANFSNNYDTRGSGVNFKLGAIIKPVYEFRIGLGIESPTFYNVDDNYYEELSLRDFNNEAINGNNSNPYAYKLRTPWKINGGLSYFFGTLGFISADINYSDYSTINFSSNEPQTDFENNRAIQNTYKEAFNYGLGAEFKVVKDFMVRAGYKVIGNPYATIENIDYSVERYSGGLGYRFGNYYVDGAITLNRSNLINDYSMYSLNNGSEPFASIKSNITNFSFTFGARF